MLKMQFLILKNTFVNRFDLFKNIKEHYNIIHTDKIKSSIDPLLIFSIVATRGSDETPLEVISW